MTKDERTFEEGFIDGYRSVQPGAPISVPPHTVPAGKTPYEWGFELGAQAARAKPSN
jgi:hypothetical protein